MKEGYIQGLSGEKRESSYEPIALNMSRCAAEVGSTWVEAQ